MLRPHAARDRTNPNSNPSLAAQRPEQAACPGLALLLHKRDGRTLTSVKSLVRSPEPRRWGLIHRSGLSGGLQLVNWVNVAHVSHPKGLTVTSQESQQGVAAWAGSEWGRLSIGWHLARRLACALRTAIYGVLTTAATALRELPAPARPQAESTLSPSASSVLHAGPPSGPPLQPPPSHPVRDFPSPAAHSAPLSGPSSLFSESLPALPCSLPGVLKLLEHQPDADGPCPWSFPMGRSGQGPKRASDKALGTAERLVPVPHSQSHCCALEAPTLGCTLEQIRWRALQGPEV